MVKEQLEGQCAPFSTLHWALPTTLTGQDRPLTSPTLTIAIGREVPNNIY